MNIEELKKLIDSSLNDKKFELETEGLSTGLKALGTDYFADGSLKLSDASIKAPDENTIIVTGTGVDLPFKGFSVEAKFYILDENAALDMTATAGSDWKFENSIPEFKGTIANDIRFTKASAFHLLSDASADWPEGLIFDATIDLDAMTGGLNGFLGIKDVPVRGPIVLTGNASEFVSIGVKGVDAIKNVSLGVVGDLLVEFGVVSQTFDDAGSETVMPCISLSTKIQVDGEDAKYQIPLSVNLPKFSSFIRFNAEINDAIQASLDDVVQLAGKIDIKKILPTDFNIGAYVKFTDLYIDFNIKEKKAEKVGMGLKSTSGWKILTVKSTGESFDAENIALTLTVSDPLNAEERAEALHIGGDIKVTDAAISISAAYPDFYVEGSLAEGPPLKISDFIQKFVGKDKEVPSLLTVDKLNFNTSDDGYSFSINLNGEWNINAAQSTVLAVEDLSFKLEYDSETEEQTAAFSGTLNIDTVGITVTADYNAPDDEDESNDGDEDEDEKGWIFTGSTGDGQKILIGDFIAYLAKAFKAGQPPKWVKSISLENLDTRFNTNTKEFKFGVTGNIGMGDNDPKIVVKFSMSPKEEEENGGYDISLSGELTIGKSVFTFKAAAGESENKLSADWSTTDKTAYLQFGDITSALGLGELPSIPEGLDLALKSANLKYDFDNKALSLWANSANYGKSVFAAKRIDDKWIYVFGINMDTYVGLNQLPLVGPDLKSVVGDVGLNGFRLVGISDTIDAKQVTEFNKLIKGEGYPTLPDTDKKLEKAVYIVVDLDLGKDNDYKFEFNTAKKPQITLVPANGADNGLEKWIDLQKNIGPIHFNRAGVAYKDGKISLLLDAALVFTALKIELLSLGVSVSNPLSKPEPAFELSGINIAYESGPVQISGGFLKSVTGNSVQYNGTAAISVQNFRLSALGSYGKDEKGDPSLFIFAMLSSPPPGGPPCFFITGLAGGFGYNRALKLPTIDTVADFPLVKAFVPGKTDPFPDKNPNTALKVMNDFVPPATGQNWVAAGVQFTSFQLVLSYALLSVEFGTNFEIGIVGMSSVSVPPATPGPNPGTPVAFAQLALNARILPEKGEVAVEAKLTPASYILSRKCVLAGGFAFYLWTAPNEHEGDFVVTLGGYHPDFKIPDHYPKVPRLSFNWEVSKEVLVKGSMYFALTPTCLMAGGKLEATFNSGNLKAWFIMGADFLIAWKPYYYRAHMYISFGVSYTFELDLAFTTITETITVSLGADLQIWGPDFSGIASIHLWIISFDISFGAADNSLPGPITWEDFKESFLPPSKKTAEHVALYGNTAELPTDTYCYSKLVNGLINEIPREKKSPLWIVSRDQTIFETYTICPAKEYSIKITDGNGKEIEHIISPQDKLALENMNTNFGVGMVDVENKDFVSKHEVIIKLDYAIDDDNHKYDAVPIFRNVPKSLWEKRVTGYGDEAMIENVLVGFRISPQALPPKRSLPIDLENFKYSLEDYQPTIEFAEPEFIPDPADHEDGLKVLKETINSEQVQQVRKNIVDALRKRKPSINPNINVAEIAAHAEDYIMAPPVLSYTYWKKSA